MKSKENLNLGEEYINNSRKVSVLVPCRNEAKYIENCIKNLYNFDPPKGGFEVIVIDGMSDDGTRDILSRLKDSYPDLIVIDNLYRTVPYAMNLGIQKAKGEYIVRSDVRCIYPRTYLVDLIELSTKTGADNVGGVLIPIEVNSYKGKSIANAYKSPIAMGGALRERGKFFGETDTVHGGCFKRSRLIEIGMYDEEMVRNQDDELSFRLRKKGGKIIQDSKIMVKYYPRGNYWHLFKQFMQYGYWKVVVIKKHPRQASLRHFLPSALLMGYGLLSIITLLYGDALFGLIAYSAGYLLPIGVESLRLSLKNNIKLWPGTFFSIVIIHLSFGIGFIVSLICRLFNIKPKWFESLSR